MVKSTPAFGTKFNSVASRGLSVLALLGSRRPFLVGLVAFGTAWGAISPVAAQNLAPLKPHSAYTAWVNKYKPATGPAPDRTASLPINKGGGLSPAYDVFWRAAMMTETGGRGQFANDGTPLKGSSDARRYGGVVISIGASQARYDIDIYGEAKPFNSYLGQTSWSLQRYLWDPTYNTAIGYGYYSKQMSQAGNNPCLAIAGYNGGAGGRNRYVAAGYKPVDGVTKMIHSHVSRFIAYSRKIAGPHSAEVNKILETSPGCSGKMDDVNPVIIPSSSSGEDVDVFVLGYCAPEAAEILRGRYQAVQQDREETLEPLLRSIKTPSSGSTATGPGAPSGGGTPPTSGQPSPGTGSDVLTDSMDRLGSCVSLSWPNLTMTYPTMDQLIRAAEKEIVQKACSAVREKIAEAKSPLMGSFYFNPRVPGVQPAGISSYGSGTPPPPSP